MSQVNNTAHMKPCQIRDSTNILEKMPLFSCSSCCCSSSSHLTSTTTSAIFPREITRFLSPTRKHKRKYYFKTPINMSLQQQPQKNILNLLWGPSLPPGLLISTVRSTWTAAWHLMMSQLAPSDPSGNYTRPASQFRAKPGSVDSTPGSLHLYVGLPCPWAHRTLIVRALKGLDHAVSVSVASPGEDGSWVFQDIRGDEKDMEKDKGSVIVPGLDKVNGCGTLKEVYMLRKDGYNGRSTVPMLWDVYKRDVFCNESYDIIEFFNSGLNTLARNPSLDLAPKDLQGEILEWNKIIYPNVNNGVYRCGFAQSQEAYDRAVNELFSTLEKIDDHLSSSRYLCGDALTLADVCLFTTLVRFDLVYNVLFKCTKKKLVEFANLNGYMVDIYQIPNVASTCNFTAIMDGYYKTLFPLNPGGIRPCMPSGFHHDILYRAHHRGSLSSTVNSRQLEFS